MVRVGRAIVPRFRRPCGAGREARLRRLDELAAKELDMLIDGSDGSVSGKAGMTRRTSLK